MAAVPPSALRPARATYTFTEERNAEWWSDIDADLCLLDVEDFDLLGTDNREDMGRPLWDCLIRNIHAPEADSWNAVSIRGWNLCCVVNDYHGNVGLSAFDS
jgi:hypothetical protein